MKKLLKFDPKQSNKRKRFLERGGITDMAQIEDKDLINKDEIRANMSLSLAPRAKMTHKTGNKHNQINRFRNNEGQDYLASGVGYVFMTKPHLNIALNEKIGDAFINSIKRSSSETAKQIVADLDGLHGGGTHTKFINLITNSVEAFETKDISLKTRDIGETFLGEKLYWGDTMFESMGGDNFTLEFTEYSDMSITLLHKTWVDYIHAVKTNKIQPYRADMHGNTTGVDYVKLRMVDYASSLYYFLLDVDGQTIKYFAKYTGVFPVSVPYSAMSFNLGESHVKKLNIQYQYSFKEDMDPRILDEFAYLTDSGISEKYDKYIDDNNLQNNWRDKVGISKNRQRLIFRNRRESEVWERK